MQIEPLKITGLAQFRRNLKSIDGEAGKRLRLAHNDAATIVINEAKPEVPMQSGAARSSLRVSSTQAYSRATGGNARTAKHYPWLDFGGRVGRRRSVRRPFFKSGRYLYPAYARRKEDVQDMLIRRLIEVAESVGMAVTDGE